MARKDVRLQKMVSDHALVRWLERVYGIDVDAVREHILTDEIKMAIQLGASKVKADGVQYVLGDGKIITIVSEQHHD